VVTYCRRLKMKASDGKMRATDCALELVLNMLADALSDVEALEAGMSSSTALSDVSTQELLSRLRRSDIPSPLST